MNPIKSGDRCFDLLFGFFYDSPGPLVSHHILKVLKSLGGCGRGWGWGGVTRDGVIFSVVVPSLAPCATPCASVRSSASLRALLQAHQVSGAGRKGRTTVRGFRGASTQPRKGRCAAERSAEVLPSAGTLD